MVDKALTQHYTKNQTRHFPSEPDEKYFFSTGKSWPLNEPVTHHPQIPNGPLLGT
jgi:hypothetical protein